MAHMKAEPRKRRRCGPDGKPKKPGHGVLCYYCFRKYRLSNKAWNSGACPTCSANGRGEPQARFLRGGAPGLKRQERSHP